MRFESLPLDPERFEPIEFIADMLGELSVVSAKIPKLEYYADEVCRLASLALQMSQVQKLGYVENLDTKVYLREKIFGTNLVTLKLGELRDEKLPTNSLPLQVGLTASQPLQKNKLGQWVRPTEIRYFYPRINEFTIFRLDDLKTEDQTNPAKMREILSLELNLFPTEATNKDKFYFYSGLVAGANERLPE